MNRPIRFLILGGVGVFVLGVVLILLFISASVVSYVVIAIILATVLSALSHVGSLFCKTELFNGCVIDKRKSDGKKEFQIELEDGRTIWLECDGLHKGDQVLLLRKGVTHRYYRVIDDERIYADGEVLLFRSSLPASI